MALGWLENGIPCRYILAIMSFFGFVFNYMLRINVNVAVVAMVNYSSIARSRDSGRDCGFNSTDDPYDPADDGPFPWDESLQSKLSGSFFWGYLVFQIPGGRLGEMYGGKWIFGLGIIITGVLNMIFPLLATDSAIYLIAARVCMGLATGATFPGMHAMLARWAPPLERTRIAAIVYAGCQAGTFIAYPLTGLIVDELGWEYVFYIMGAASLVWGGLWFYLVYDSPSVHPRINKEELAYLTESIGVVQKKDQPVPWKAIATSMPFWAIMVAHLGNNWGFWMLLTELPIYLKNILHYDIKGNSIQSALPYLCMWLFSMFYGAMADVVLQKKWLSRKNIRKWAEINSHLFGAIMLVGVANAGCDDILTLILFNVSVGLQGAIYTGFLSNHMDIAPNFAGTLYGLTNCVGSIPSFVAPLTAGAITKGAQTLANWQTVFYISAGWYAGGAIFFAIFADGEIQSWNYYGLKEDPEGNSNDKPSETDKSAPTCNTFNTQVPKLESSAKEFPENPLYSTNKNNYLKHDSLDSGSNKRRKFNGSTEKAQTESGNT